MGGGIREGKGRRGRKEGRGVGGKGMETTLSCLKNIPLCKISLLVHEMKMFSIAPKQPLIQSDEI